MTNRLYIAYRENYHFTYLLNDYIAFTSLITTT